MKHLLFWLLVSLSLPLPALAGDPIYQVDGVALGGSDPVAYFVEGAPTVGSSEFAVEKDGVTWHFASAEHRDLFLADPARYMPQYGGYCAYAAAKGAKAPTDPAAWTIFEDKLYLNFSLDVQKACLPEKSAFIAEADRLWPTIQNQ